MHRAHSLSFINFSLESNHFTFSYLLDNEKIDITLQHSEPIELTGSAQQTVLFNLGICYLLDLAELTFPSEVHIHFGLSELQLEFWRQTHHEVSQEKLYKDQLDGEVLESSWQCTSNKTEFPLFQLPTKRQTTALCMTGGKESLVLLKKLKKKNSLLLFFLNTETNVHRQKAFERLKQDFPATRTMSNRSEVFRKLKKKYQSALGSGVDMAHLIFNTLLYGMSCKQVVIGNEYSSNFPNTVYQGSVINHQYIKTWYFAQRINNYLHKFVTPDFTYYSPFFGMYEYKIAKYLFEDQDYLDVWTSCNHTTTEVNFCCNCAKCAFTYLISLVYTDADFLKQYFTRDLLADVKLYRPLIDFTGEKPLDCVGEKKEVWVALWKLSLRVEYKKTAVVQYFVTRIFPFIEDELPTFEKEVTTIQKIPQHLPSTLVIA